jgi:putative cell wall-binding protein
VPPSPPAPAAAPKVYRDAGDDRIGTGIAISQQRWTASGSAKAVVLATSLNYPDALSGGPLAAKKGGPLLLTDGSATRLDPRVLAEIRRVLPAHGAVQVLGGDSAMNPAIIGQLKSLGYTVAQYKGTNRADTALRVARDGMGSPQHAVLATGTGFADALAAGPYAAGPFADAPGAPAAILLSDGAHLDTATAAYLDGKTVATVGAQAGHARPIAAKSFPGLDRFDTAARVAREFTGTFATTQVGIANGVASTTNPGYPDALTGGTFMAESNGPIVLVDGINSSVPAESQEVLASRASNTRADIFGGTSVISPALAASIVTLLHGTAQF